LSRFFAHRFLGHEILSFLLTLFSLIVLSSVQAAELTRFSPQDVINLAEQLSFTPYQAPAQAPKKLSELSYNEYRAIQYNKDAAIWGKDPIPFSIELFAPGYLYRNLVDVHIVEAGKSYPLTLSDKAFDAHSETISEALTALSRYAGFRLHYPLNNKDYADEFIVFQGASYFRAVSKGQVYGLSARGLALNVGERQGEEFPIFKQFWIERPAREQQAIVVHALLDSPSVTGAYRFGIYPNDPTFIEVSATLFPRSDLNHVGIAPLTSMFMHSPMVPPRVSDYRPAVHDSEALAIKMANGEQLWRPLNNPKRLQISAFQDHNPKGFGLIQRQRHLDYYQDLEAHYHQRPSLWVKPTGAWGQGHVQLVEIPSDSEGNDNIVAYWRPASMLEAGKRYTFSYQLQWVNDIKPSHSNARIVRSALGTKLFTEYPEVVIDISDVNNRDMTSLDVSLSAGKLIEKRVQDHPDINGVRLFMCFDPNGAEQSEIRIQLKHNDTALAETWLYRWLKPSWR
jgi:glucan biosynthesis protein